jgi:hypothetical protein
MADTAHLHRLTQQLANEGRLVEAGWVALRIATIPPDTSASQLQALRMTYYSGAEHIFSSIVGMNDMSGSDEPTDADMHRMDLLQAEMERIRPELRLFAGLTKGSA